jgi:hypothetical protein
MQDELRTSRDAQALADVADVDLRTVIRYLAGLPIRRRSRARIERAIDRADADGRNRCASEAPPAA